MEPASTNGFDHNATFTKSEQTRMLLLLRGDFIPNSVKRNTILRLLIHTLGTRTHGRIEAALGPALPLRGPKPCCTGNPRINFLPTFLQSNLLSPAHLASRSNVDLAAPHFTLRHHNAARVKVCVRSRCPVLVLGADGRNIQVSARIVIGRS